MPEPLPSYLQPRQGGAERQGGSVFDSAFAEIVPLPMMIVGMDNVVRHANKAAETALGVALPGYSVEEFASEEDIPETSLCHRIQVEDSVPRVEIRARRPDGRVLWLLASAQRFTHGTESGYVLVFQDVSALKLRELRLTEANEEAERNIRARMRFLAAASHDLRQPLQAMALFASALDHHVATPQGRTIVQSLKTSLRGMEEMFDSLLDMSKLDAGVMKAEVQTFLINDIFEQLEVTYVSQAEAAGLDLRIVPSSLAVKSDPRLLARILANFLSNALRYTRSGGVLLGVRRHGNRVWVAVYDTGPGIAESQRLEIFREFRQGQCSPAQGRGDGMGLGLSIVQRLSRLLNHRVEVRSVPACGSVFAVEVPLAPEFMPAEAVTADDDELEDISGAVVLVMDDNVEIQRGLKLLLDEWGCHAIIAASADEALAQLEKAGVTPEVILSDLHLGTDNGGIGAIETIRTSMGKNAPAFLFTGDTGASGDILDEADLLVLRKPVAPLRLRLLLGTALKG